MAISEDQSQHKASMARYERLMTYRKAMINDIADLSGIDLDIAMAFEPQAAEAIERRLHQLNELPTIRKDIMTMKLPPSQVKACISRIFSTEGYQMFEDDVARWKDLKKAWEQMTELRIDTSHIHRRLTTVFETPASDQELPQLIPTTMRNPSVGKVLRKRTASAELESMPGTKRQALTERTSSVIVPRAEHSDCWPSEGSSNWSIGVHSICMQGKFYQVDAEHVAALRPEKSIEAELIQVFQSSIQATGWNFSQHAWVNVTRLHPELFLWPLEVHRMITANQSPKARIVHKRFSDKFSYVDITFVEPSEVTRLLSKLRDARDVCEEQIDSKQMNEMFAKSKLGTERVRL